MKATVQPLLRPSPVSSDATQPRAASRDARGPPAVPGGQSSPTRGGGGAAAAAATGGGRGSAELGAGCGSCSTRGKAAAGCSTKVDARAGEPRGWVADGISSPASASCGLLPERPGTSSAESRVPAGSTPEQDRTKRRRGASWVSSQLHRNALPTRCSNRRLAFGRMRRVGRSRRRTRAGDSTPSRGWCFQARRPPV